MASPKAANSLSEVRKLTFCWGLSLRTYTPILIRPAICCYHGYMHVIEEPYLFIATVIVVVLLWFLLPSLLICRLL